MPGEWQSHFTRPSNEGFGLVSRASFPEVAVLLRFSTSAVLAAWPTTGTDRRPSQPYET